MINSSFLFLYGAPCYRVKQRVLDFTASAERKAQRASASRSPTRGQQILGDKAAMGSVRNPSVLSFDALCFELCVF